MISYILKNISHRSIRQHLQMKAAWCYSKYSAEYEAWVTKHPFLDDPAFSHFFQKEEIVYLPDSLPSGKWIAAEIDYTHIGSRLRRMVVAGAIPGVDPEAWRTVAKKTTLENKPKTNLTTVIVDSSGADQMSMTQTLTFFSASVAKELKESGYPPEHQFCNAVNKWLTAHDARGITADIRIDMMMVLHEMLMDKVSVCFPPPTSSTKWRFNFNLIEDIVCGTQARLCLYIITKETGYAARSFSSIDVENAHSIINHLDRRGVQNSSIEELSRHVSNLQRLQILRKTSLGRKLYTPTSTIYHAPEIDKGLSDRLTSSQFDLSKPSGKNKELKPHGRNDAPRGQGRVRAIGGHKTREYLFYKG